MEDSSAPPLCSREQQEIIALGPAQADARSRCDIDSFATFDKLAVAVCAVSVEHFQLPDSMRVVPRELDSQTRNRGVVEYGGAGVDILRLRGSGAPTEEPGGCLGNANHAVGAAGLGAVGAAGACGTACDGDGDGR